MPIKISAILDLLKPGLWGAMEKADPSIKTAHLQADPLTDNIELVVVHTLFSRAEIADNLYKQVFSERVRRALLAADMESV